MVDSYDWQIEEILKDCKQFNVPVVFALSRNKLGKALGRVSPTLISVDDFERNLQS